MSIVVAIRRNNSLVVAADTLTCYCDDESMPSENASSEKITRIGWSILGGAGWGVYDDIFSDFLSDRDPPTFDSERSIFSFFLELWKALHDRYTFVNDQASDKDSPFGDLDSSFLIANHTGIYRVASDLSVSRFQQYAATGSGSQYALGAIHSLYHSRMSAREIADAAVRAAMAFNVFCGGDVQLLEIEMSRP